jgi:uncharacterized protein
MWIDYPFSFDSRGRTATTDYNDHVRDMIEQLLFTSPGERVNNPEYGSGVLQLVFGPASPEIAATVEFTTQAALQRWLGDVIEVAELLVEAEEATLRVSLRYRVLRTGAWQVEQFTGSSGL